MLSWGGHSSGEGKMLQSIGPTMQANDELSIRGSARSRGPTLRCSCGGRIRICDQKVAGDRRREHRGFAALEVRSMARLGLLFWDLILSFLWAWSGALIRVTVQSFLRLGRSIEGEALKVVLSVLCMYFFAMLGLFSRGGSYNPLAVLSSAFSASFDGFLFAAFGRIPAQIVGSVVGVRSIREFLPEIGYGSRLKVKIHHGALTEGFLTFMTIMTSLGLKKKDPGSFFLKTWILAIAKLSLHILGSDLTGGIMNPASAFGWAYARGDHITLEHLFVYWLAPIQATVLAVWAFKLFLGSKESKQKHTEEQKAVKAG
ncbi:putative aquaporin SIP2-1 [Platanthera guangdongensis]|uniref:Aquaporin SIP2-1 n=1 Tax=Platanthera guangdongensis TaxID=2320717 RepID=A0ABR2MDI3_9ASPA